MALRKFKFVEEFIDPATGQPYPDTGSPKKCKTTHFGEFYGHQIAKIDWKKKIVKRKTTTVDKKTGKTVEGEEKEFVEYEERMGEKGGWLESMGNLAQGGKCWVKSGGYILGKAFVSEDAIVEGEVGESAKVYGEATVKSGAGVGGAAAVFGKATVSSKWKGGAVIGNAKVYGEASVEGEAVVQESARVTGKAKVSGDALVGGLAQILGEGKVGGQSSVKENVIVYGEVDGNASVMGSALILEDGVVRGKAIVSSGTIVKGKVTGDAIVNSGQPFIAQKGEVIGKASIEGNAYIDSNVNEANISGNAKVAAESIVRQNTKMSGNATVGQAGMLDSKSTMSENAWVDGRAVETSLSDNAMVGDLGKATKCSVSGNGNVNSNSSQSEVSGGYARGQLSKGKLKDGAFVFKAGSVNNGTAEGSAVVGGGVSQGNAKGGAVIASGGSLSSGTADGNAKIAASHRGSAKGNGIVSGSSSNSVSDNGILLAEGMGASGNQVFKESDNAEPGEAAVICKVEKE